VLTRVEGETLDLPGDLQAPRIPERVVAGCVGRAGLKLRRNKLADIKVGYGKGPSGQARVGVQAAFDGLEDNRFACRPSARLEEDCSLLSNAMINASVAPEALDEQTRAYNSTEQRSSPNRRLLNQRRLYRVTMQLAESEQDFVDITDAMIIDLQGESGPEHPALMYAIA
jgi:hypothetical protein